MPRSRSVSEVAARAGVRGAIAVAILTWLVVHLADENWSFSIGDGLALIALCLIILSIAMLFRAGQPGNRDTE